MITYVSNALPPYTYNKMSSEGRLIGNYQSQKFNSSVIDGLSAFDEVCCLSIPPYVFGEEEGAFHEVTECADYSVVQVSGKIAKKPLLLMRGVCSLLKLIGERKPNYIVVDAISGLPLAVCAVVKALKNIPLVGIVTDLKGAYETDDVEFLRSKNKMMRACDGYVLLTHEMNEVINIDSKPYLVMEGIAPKDIPEIDEGRSVRGHQRRYLYAGTLNDGRDGVKEFITAFIQAKTDNAELHIYGTGNLESWIEKMAADNKRIMFHGRVTNDEMVRLQIDADVLVNPRPTSLPFCKYSFPSKTIEYLLSGTPVLMTKLPGVPDEYFKYVTLIEEESPDGYRRAIEKLEECDFSQLKKKALKGRQFVIENKSARRQAERVHSLGVLISSEGGCLG